MNAWRRSRFFHFDVAVVSVVAVLIVAFSLAERRRRRRRRPDAGARRGDRRPGPDRRRGAGRGSLGLSIEYPALEAYAGADPSSLDPVFEQLVRNLAPGQAPVLRIGGNSADRTWWPVAGVSAPPGVTFDITHQWLAVTRALAQTLGAHLILGVNLEQDSPQLAAAEARALINGVGPQVGEGARARQRARPVLRVPVVQLAAVTAVLGRPQELRRGCVHPRLRRVHRAPCRTCRSPARA